MINITENYQKKRIAAIQFNYRFTLLIVASLLLIACATSENTLQKVNKRDISKIQDPFSLAGSNIPVETEEKPVTADEIEQLGDALFKSGNLSQAYVQYEKYLKEEPNQARVLYKKGLLLLAANSNQEAIEVFQNVLREEPENALVHEGMGRAYYKMKQYLDAEECFKKAIQINPRWDYYNFLGIICDYQKKYNLAISYYKEAVAHNPNEGALYNNIGVSYTLAGNYKEAIVNFNAALAHNYNERKVYNNLGVALAKDGKHQEALEAFTKGGTEAQAYNNLGCIYLNEGEIDAAINSFEKSISMNPQIDVVASSNLKKARVSKKSLSDNNPHIKRSSTGSDISQNFYHVVKYGENLYRISVKYGMSLNDLCMLNHISPNNVIIPGQKLKIR